MDTKSIDLFNPSYTPNTQQLPAKVWELLRRNKNFRQKVQKLRTLDKQAREETINYSEIARRLNQANAGQDATRGECQRQYDLVKDRPIRKKTFGLIEKHQKTHPLAALALNWLVPEPLFAACRAREGRAEEGTGPSPNLTDPSWIWWESDKPQGAISHYIVRGPEIASHFEDWHNWRPGEALFDCGTPWNRLPKSFKTMFVKVWRRNYDFKDAYEFNYVHPPRQTDSLTPADFEKYLEFLDTVMHRRLFAISPSILTTKDVGEVFERLQNRIKKNLPESRDHLFGSKAAWKHYLAIKEEGLSLSKHIVGADYQAENSTVVTEKVSNQRKNVKFGVKAIDKLIALVYPVFELKKAVLVHSAPPRDKKSRRKPQISKPMPEKSI